MLWKDSVSMLSLSFNYLSFSCSLIVFLAFSCRCCTHMYLLIKFSSIASTVAPASCICFCSMYASAGTFYTHVTTKSASICDTRLYINLREMVILYNLYLLRLPSMNLSIR